jgi:hypothetical protein
MYLVVKRVIVKEASQLSSNNSSRAKPTMDERKEGRKKALWMNG